MEGIKLDCRVEPNDSPRGDEGEEPGLPHYARMDWVPAFAGMAKKVKKGLTRGNKWKMSSFEIIVGKLAMIFLIFDKIQRNINTCCWQ